MANHGLNNVCCAEEHGGLCPIIVIDNHSDDNTVEILESWKDELSFMRVEYLNSNIGFWCG